MAQPKTPPISLRIPPFLLARLEVWAEENGTTRNAAIVGAIEALVAEPAVIVVPPKLKSAPVAPRVPPKLAEPAGGRAAVQFGPSPSAPGSRLRAPRR